jgi:1,4-dihydroxy-2-naphthoate octaprenyltransferase
VSLSSFIARLGVNPIWIAANAHVWFAAFAVTIGLRHVPWWLLVPVALALAALKEFVFDAQREVPKQTFKDNLTDFAGYVLGVGIALLTRPGQ